MDHATATDTRLNTLALDVHPAYLFIGDPDTLLDHIITQMQTYFCSSGHSEGCGVCSSCRKIRQQQHESILWLNPEKQYALDDLKPIFNTVSFALESDRHYFFILQKADTLTISCANALLKSLEEPPAGYHFILLAQRVQAILPTIKSRCLIHYYDTKTNEPLANLLAFFTTTSFQDPVAFTKELDQANPNEWQSLDLIDQLINYWAQQYKKSVIARDDHALKQSERMLHHLKKAIMQPPMPGSAKLFWKNLFLQIKEL